MYFVKTKEKLLFSTFASVDSSKFNKSLNTDVINCHAFSNSSLICHEIDYGDKKNSIQAAIQIQHKCSFRN